MSLDSYKTRIEGVIFRHTGYTLTVGNIKTMLSNNYLPEIIIQNAKLTNPVDPKQNFAVKRLEFVFSFSSVWNFEPIFNRISIDGTNINLEYLSDGSIIFNGINLNHPDKKTLENTKNSPIDLENLILKQKRIELSNVNFSFSDKKSNLPKLELTNVTTILTSGGFHQHNFQINFGHGDEKNVLEVKLNWVGGKITEFNKWREAELKIQSYDKNNHITTALKRYIPDISLLDEFYAETALDAQIKKGKLQFLYANFDAKNLRYALPNSQNQLDFPELGGSIRINLVNENHYILDASNLTIATPDGYIFNNKNLSGNYTINTNGNINLADTDLQNLNNLFTMLTTTNKLKLSGKLEIINFNWQGSIFAPHDLNLKASFKNVAIISKNPNIPSINNVSGGLSIKKDAGVINLSLEHSILNYGSVFLIPYKFNNLITQINYKENPDKTITFNLVPTKINTPDFNASVSGKYIYKAGTSGYLDLNAHVDRVMAHKVGDYLPIVIGLPVHKWLNMGLIGGYGAKASLELKGWLSDFPFRNGNGTFYIDADVDNGKLCYTKGWPIIDHINGQFQIRNQKIIILAKHGIVANNLIESAIAVIPDMTADNVYLLADGIASGSTQNFMTYLKQTPINEMIGKIPEKVTASGDGKVQVHLNIPFADPTKTRVNGSYVFNNNTVMLALPVPPLNNVNGKLLFSESGIQINKISATSLNSPLILTANTGQDRIIHFRVTSNQLNYSLATKFYLPFISSLISGSALTNINFDIGSHGINRLTLQSSLLGVKIDAANPLSKTASSKSNLNLTLLTNNISGFNLNFAYADLLFGNVSLDSNGNLVYATMSLGSSNLPSRSSNNPKIIIAANLVNTYVVEWRDVIEKILSPKDATTTNTLSKENHSKSDDIQEVLPDTANNVTKHASTTFPIELLLNSNNVWVNNTNFYHTSSDVIVNSNNLIFNLNNTLANGYGIYSYTDKHLQVHLNKFDMLKSTSESVVVSKNQNIDNSKTWITFAKMNLDNASNHPTKIESENYLYFAPSLANAIESDATTSNFPSTTLTIDHFYYENHELGKFGVQLEPAALDLLIKNGVLNDNNTTLTFSGVNFCMSCDKKKSVVNLKMHANIKNLGTLLENLNYGKIVSKGSGTVDTSLEWNGGLPDFDLRDVAAIIKIDIKDGSFLKVNTGSIFGELIGIINLQTITNLISLDFGQIFSSGFYFNNLKIQASLLNNRIDLKSMHMTGPMADVKSNGIIDIGNDQLNVFLTVTPHLGASVAVGAAIATGPLGIIVGPATYATEWILGQPFNKLFAFSFHITGSLENPIVKQGNVTTQIVKNVSSAIGAGN